MVKGIESFYAELESHAFGEFKCLIQTQIEVVDARSAEYVPSAVAELASQRLRETCCVEPVSDTPAARIHVATWNLIGTLREGTQQTE